MATYISVSVLAAANDSQQSSRRYAVDHLSSQRGAAEHVGTTPMAVSHLRFERQRKHGAWFSMVVR